MYATENHDLSQEGTRTIRNYDSLNGYAYECAAGITFFNEESSLDDPKALLSFGEVWSYQMHRCFFPSAKILSLIHKAVIDSPDTTYYEDDEHRVVNITDDFIPYDILRLANREIEIIFRQAILFLSLFIENLTAWI